MEELLELDQLDDTQLINFSESDKVEDTMDTEDLGLDEITDSLEDKLSDDLEYPCLVLSGMVTKEEIVFWSTRRYDSEHKIALYLKFDGIIKQAGFVNFDLELCQVMSLLADYTVELHKAKGVCKTLDVRNPNVLINLIKI